MSVTQTVGLAAAELATDKIGGNAVRYRPHPFAPGRNAGRFGGGGDPHKILRLRSRQVLGTEVPQDDARLKENDAEVKSG